MSYEQFDWPRLSGLIAVAFRMDETRAASFSASRAAKLVAALPYAAGCPRAERVALAHLGTFVLACYGDTRLPFDHLPEDDGDPLARLAPVADHPGGNPAVVRAGLSRLALMMLNGYERDLDADRARGLYNPLLKGSWKAEDKRAELKKASASVASELLDAAITTEEALRAWWEM